MRPPGSLAYVAHHLGVHHSPDVFHVQHELRKAMSGPMATKQRAAAKAATTAEETLEQAQEHAQSAGGEPATAWPGASPEGTPPAWSRPNKQSKRLAKSTSA